MRKDRQKSNNNIVKCCLLKRDATLKHLANHINTKELDRVLFELNYSFEELHKKCLEDLAFCKVVAGRISKTASRQGVRDELFILHKINSFTCQLGVFVGKPKNELVVFKSEIILKKKVKFSCFRSIDAVISGKLTGYMFCKVILGKGSTQTNSWLEAKFLIQ